MERKTLTISIIFLGGDIMLEVKINELKKDLNDMMDKEIKDPDKILEISEKLDVLIVEYYKMIDIYEK